VTCWNGPSPAPTPSSPTCRPSPAWRPRPATSRCWPACWTGRRRSAGSPWTPNCGWRLLRRLISRGAAGEAEIEAELARDATDAGARHAAACRAATPNPAAKEAAWQQIVSGTLPNAVFRAVLDGFADPDQAELLEPYQRRYFEVVGDIWRDWSSDMAQWFVANAYPLADSHAVIEATDALIATTSPPGALRRLLIEGGTGSSGHCAARHATAKGWLTAPRRHARPGGRQVFQQDRPLVAVASGTHQLGYCVMVPGRFCGRRSPTASASETPTSAAGVRAR
jgi:hypothetical protein